MFDEATLNSLAGNYRNYQKQQATTKAQPKKKLSGRGGTLTSLISEGGAVGGGAAGATIGTAVLPGVGTLVGGALGAGIGAFTGRLAENKVRDNRYGVADATKEGLVTGLLSAPGKGLKVGYSATKALTKGGGLEEALVAANTAATKKGVVGGTANKVRTSAADRSAKGYGINTTDKFLPDQADEVASFINKRAGNYAKVTPGAPMNQARDLQQVKNGVIKQLDTHLNAINRPIKPNEAKKLISNLDNRLINDPDITGDTALANKFKTLVANKDIKGIEKLRQQYDDIAFKANGDPSTAAKGAEAMAIRDTIDEFITPLSKEYKAIKGDYGLANKALQLASKEGGRKQNGITPPFMSGGLANKGVFGNTIAATSNKVNGKLAGTGAVGAVTPTLGSAKATGARMGAQGSLADALVGGQTSNNDATMATTQDTSTMPMNNDIMGGSYQNGQDLSSGDQNPYPRENLLADIQRDPANMDDYIKLYQQYQEMFTPQQAELTSAQQTRAAAAQNALGDFPLIEDAISSGKLGGLKNIPGSGTSVGRRLLGTEDLDAALFNIADNILRARSGAAAPEAEVLRFKNTFLPGPLDSEVAKRSKLDRAMRELQGYVNPQGAAAGSNRNELVDALMQSGYGQ